MKQLPPTRRGRWFGRILGGAWIASIAGIVLTLNALFSRLLDVGFDPAGLGLKFLALTTVTLCGWALICVVGYRGSRRNEMPPSWALLTIVGLAWVAILINRTG
ncbi:MAG TPA: hypothetical protein VJT67_07750 [Longimicrobiaceae bacterium]|nr:hypothetical protein [Longimicrobiaceae bacterium]